MKVSQPFLSHAGHDEDPHLGPFERGFVLAFIAIPFLGLIYGIWQAVSHGVDLFYLVLLVFFYVTTALGITVGFHRLFTHESFKTKPAVEFLLAVFGTMAYQGRPLVWCPNHSDHHQHSDKEGDPHSPWRYVIGIPASEKGKRFWGLFKGFWYAQFGWLFLPMAFDQNSACLKRLRANKIVSFVDRWALVWMFLRAFLPAVAGYMHDHSWTGTWNGFLWGGLIPLFLLQHVTWAINSYCHLWGKKNFASGDHSMDSLLFIIFAMGEGAHNGHHAFSRSALHALLYPWLDASYLFIRSLKLCGLVWDVQVPSLAQIQAKRIRV